MTSSGVRGPRRTDALSRRRIIEAAVEVLDAAGEGGLTVRALSAHLSTGRGAIYHHVSAKEEMLAEAADVVVGQVLAEIPAADPSEGIRALSLGVFDAIDAHPWVGAQLSREPAQPAVLRIWTGLGSLLAALGVTGAARSDAGAALVNYILGAAAQYAAGARRSTGTADRAAHLATVAAEWTEHDPDPLVLDAAAQLTGHDDRAQFLAGVDIFLAGVTAGR